MEQQILDLSFLYDLSGSDTAYVHDVINLFIDVVPPGIEKLAQLIYETNDFDAIHKQAHFLKSSASIIKIKDVYEDLARIVTLSREQRALPEIRERLKNIQSNFDIAMPLIRVEQGKTAVSGTPSDTNI